MESQIVWRRSETIDPMTTLWHHIGETLWRVFWCSSCTESRTRIRTSYHRITFSTAQESLLSLCILIGPEVDSNPLPSHTVPYWPIREVAQHPATKAGRNSLDFACSTARLSTILPIRLWHPWQPWQPCLRLCEFPLWQLCEFPQVTGRLVSSETAW